MLKLKQWRQQLFDKIFPGLSVWVFIDENGRIIEGEQTTTGRKILTRTRKPGEYFAREYGISHNKKVTPVEAKLIINKIGGEK